MNPKVSTILCCYNQAEWVAEAIESVLGQTHQNVELIAIDNGSTDGSADVMRRYEADDRVVLILHSENDRITKRQNEGIARSTGDFISILYADDFYLPQKFERQLERFATVGADVGVVYAPAFRLNEVTGERWLDASISRSGWILGALMSEYHSHGFINPISPLMRREVVERFPFRETLFAEGESVYFRYAVAYEFAFIDEPLAVMRDRVDNISKAIKRNMANFLETLDLLGKEPDFPAAMQGNLERFRTDLFRNYGWQGLRMAEDQAWARQCLLEAVSRNMAQILQPKVTLGIGLSLIPRPLLRRMNVVANRLSPSKAVAGFREDYI